MDLKRQRSDEEESLLKKPRLTNDTVKIGEFSISEKTVVIVVEGGLVQDVLGLPEGFTYVVQDMDVEGEEGPEEPEEPDPSMIIVVEGGGVQDILNLPMDTITRYKIWMLRAKKNQKNQKNRTHRYDYR